MIPSSLDYLCFLLRHPAPGTLWVGYPAGGRKIIVIRGGGFAPPAPATKHTCLIEFGMSIVKRRNIPNITHMAGRSVAEAHLARPQDRFRAVDHV
jgi:hypothetical protein